MGAYRVAMGLFAVACGFQHGRLGLVGDGAIDGARGSGSDAALDASNEPAMIYAIDDTTLYTVDIAGKSITAVAALHDSTNNPVTGIDSIAYVDGKLFAVTAQESTQSFAEIDPATALVTVSALPALDPDREYYGLTYDPVSQQLLAAAQDTAALYRGDASANTMTSIGAFGQSLTVYGDIAWLDGVLYGTMFTATCTRCRAAATCSRSIPARAARRSCSTPTASTSATARHSHRAITSIATRRLACDGPAVGSAGRDSTSMRVASIPSATSARFTLSARSCDSFVFASAAPVASV